MRSPASSQSRTLVWVGIIAGHAVLIYLMATSRTPHRLDRVEEFHSQPIYLLPFIEEPPQVPRADVPAPAIRPRPVVAESTAITIAEPQQVPAVENAQAPQVDWANAATTAIQNMARNATVPETFGERKQEEAPAKGPPGIFEKQSPREAGYTEELAPGITRRWLSEKCYMEFGHLPELFPTPGPKFIPVRCIVGSAEVEGKLFDHLKPDYLKKK